MSVFPQYPGADIENENYYTSDDFVTRSMLFIAKYHWIYDFQLTHFLSERVWEHIPTEVMHIPTQINNTNLAISQWVIM